jgi:transposase InsO family protein
LLEEMRAIFEASDGSYGSPRIQHALLTGGPRVSRRRVARLMRQDGLRPRVVRVYRGKAGVHRWFSRQPNHVGRTQATRPNQIWVGDVTYLAVAGRWWYLVVVLDQCSRRVLAWRLAATRDSRVTRAVLDAALRRRCPDAGLIFHTDRGSEFQGTRVRTHLRASAVRQSMTRGGAPGENAHMESFFHSLKADVIHGRTFTSVAELAASCGATCGTTTTGVCIRRWGINHPLTMNSEPRRNHLSTEPRQDPGRRCNHERPLVNDVR